LLIYPTDLARKVLQELTQNAVIECRFKDSAYYYWLLSRDDAGDDAYDVEQHVLADWELKADLYFAYSTIHAFITDPFTSHQPEMLFQCCRFLINSLGNSELVPLGISKAATLYTLARQAMVLKTHKLARHAYDRLGKLQLPRKKQDEIELDMLIVQAKPMRDDPDQLPVCYRCGSTNPLLNPFTSKFAKADVCTNCGHPFVRSFISFDVLPLVEFVPEKSIPDDEAIELIRQPPSEKKFGAGMGARNNNKPEAKGKGGNARGGGGGLWKESKEGSADTMTFDGPSNDSYDPSDYGDDMGMGMGGMGGPGQGGGGDMFAACLQRTLGVQVTKASAG
jgi:intraflagellar transport protein 122